MQKGLLFIIGTALISGVSIFLNAFGVSGLDPFAFTGMKNLLVALFLISALFLFTKTKELRTVSLQQWGTLSLIGLLGGSIPFLLFFKGLSLGSGASGAFVHKTMILWVTLGALFFLKEKLNWKIITGAAVLLVGNFFLLQLNGISISAGLIYVFIATLLWSTEILLSKKLLQKISASTVVFGRMGIGAAIILIYLMISGHLTSVLTWNASAWGWVFLTTIFLLGYVMTFYKGLQTIKASTAVAVLSLGSIITSLLQLIFLDKVLSLVQIFGIVFMSLGLVLVYYAQQETQNTRA